MKYNITIIETLSRSIEIEGDSYDDALMKVEEMYDNQEIILDPEEFKGKNDRIKRMIF